MVVELGDSTCLANSTCLAPNTVGATTHSMGPAPAGAHHYTAGTVVPHPVNHVAPSAPAVSTTGHQPAPVVTKHVKVPTPVHVDAPYSVHVPTPVAGEPIIGRTPVPYTHAVVPVEAPPSTEMQMLFVLSRPPVCPTDPPWPKLPRPS